jgi:hypothetical protein
MKKIVSVGMVGMFLASAVSAQVSAPSEKPKDRSDPDYVRCRVLDVTGSLVKKDKICKTNREWEALRTRNNSEAERFIEQNRTGSNQGG